MKAIWIIITAVLAVVVIVTASFFAVSFIDLHDSASSAKIIVAIIVFVSTLISIGLSLFGILLKNSIDSRRLSLEKETEKRLEQESAIKAIELLKVASDSGSSTAETSGALFALVILGKIDFALRLLEVLWPEQKVPSASAVLIVNKGLQSEAHDIQLLSSDILLENASQLPDGHGKLVWPSIMRSFDWPNNEVEKGVRSNLIRALLRALIEKRSNYWKKSTFYWLIGMLWNIFKSDSDSQIKTLTTLSIDKFINLLEDSEIILSNNGDIKVSDIRAEVSPHLNEARESLRKIFEPIINRIQDWTEEANKDGFQNDY